MSRRHVVFAVTSLVIAGGTTTVIMAATTGPPDPVRVHPAVNPRLTHAEVAQIVLGRIPDAAIEKMDVLADDTLVPDLEPNAGHTLEAPVGPVWVVRARGHFVGRRTPPGVPEVVKSSGFFVIDDNTGDVIEIGMP